MAYPKRVDFPGQIAHVTTRATGWDALFVDRSDREHLLALLGITSRRYRWKIHAFCLLTNHVHLVVETEQATLGRGMQYLVGTYARAFNEKCERRGHLSMARYFSRTIETEEYYLECLRYVALNPVRAGLCSRPEAYPWSSYAAPRRLAPAPSPELRELVEVALASETAT